MKIKKRITTHEEIEIEVSLPCYFRIIGASAVVAVMSETYCVHAQFIDNDAADIEVRSVSLIVRLSSSVIRISS